MTDPNRSEDRPKKVCDRIFNDGGAHTVRFHNGVAYCLSCGQPTKEHKS